jgi:YVTN family beta-propeller protein
MRTRLENEFGHLGNLLLKSAFWMAAFIAAVGLCSVQAVAATGYVANIVDGTVSVINTATNTAVATIPTNGAGTIAVTPDGTRAYVVSFGGVSVIDTATNTVVGSPIPVGAFTDSVFVGIAITPNGSRVYVANSGSGTVSVISTASNTVVDTISVGTTPSGIAITPNGSSVYVANSGSGTVSVISTASNTVVATIPVGAFGIAITPDGAHAYVANAGAGNVSVIDIATNTVVATIPGFSAPVAVAITPDGTHVYVVNVAAEPPDQTQSVSVIATASNTVVGSPILVGPRVPNTALMGLGITPDGTAVYVANGGVNTLSVISTASNTVTGSATVGNGPVAVAFAPLLPPAQVRLLISSVQALVNAHAVNGGQGNSLIVTLRNASGYLPNQPAQAINQLRVFVGKVNTFISEGVLTQAEGQSLLGSAQAIIAELGS